MLIVIAERDSRWVDWACAWRNPEHTLLVLALGDESRERLCDRILATVARTRDGDKRRIVFAPGTCWDGPALLARAHTIRSVLACVATLPSATRVLLDSGPKDGPGTLGMEAIAEAVLECGLSTTTQLRVVPGASAAALLAA